MRRFAASSCSLALLLAFVGCDKKPEASSPSAVAPAGSASAKAAFLEAAPRLGMAALIPQDAELYFGSVGMKGHREALLKTAFWKQVEAYSQEKKPAKEGEVAPVKKLEEMQINDWFVAAGAGATKPMAWLKSVNELYSEYTYLMLVAGYTGAGSGSSFNLDAILANAAAYPGVLDKVCTLLEQMEVPPLIAGVHSDKPEALLKDMFDPAKPPAWLAKAKKDTLTTPQGGQLTVYEGTAGDWLTQEVRTKWLERIAISVKDEAVKARIAKTLDTVATKKFAFAQGIVSGYTIVATATDKSQIRFAAAPEQSLLARTEFGFAQEHAAKNLMALVYADGGLLQAMHQDQPLAPMLRGMLSGLSGNETFASLVAKVQPKLADFQKAEQAVYAAKFNTVAGAFWWEKGLHLDMRGGYAVEGDAWQKPLQFGHLLNTPTALFAMNGHDNSRGTLRAYFEQLFGLTYIVAGELIQGGLGGDQAKGIYTLVDKLVLPSLLQVYDASKDVYQKALGSESVILLDVGGEIPVISGVTPPAQQGAKPAKMIRIASVHPIVDRALLATSWDKMAAALNQAAQSSPIPMQLPAPASTRENGVTSWFYPLPVSGNDLLPTVSLTDKIYVLGSSKALNEKLAASAQSPDTAAPVGGAAAGSNGFLFRGSASALRDLLKSLATSGLPNTEPESLNAAAQWLAPVENLQGRLWQDGDRIRTQVDWEMHDLSQKYD